MTTGDELTIHRIDSRDNWRGEVVGMLQDKESGADVIVQARLGNGALLEFWLDDGLERHDGKWRLAPKHVRRKR
jgi:hypothetical protein